MERVKGFSGRSLEHLAGKINQWLEANPDVEISDIKYSSVWIGDKDEMDEGRMEYSALVLYKSTTHFQ